MWVHHDAKFTAVSSSQMAIGYVRDWRFHIDDCSSTNLLAVLAPILSSPGKRNEQHALRFKMMPAHVGAAEERAVSDGCSESDRRNNSMPCNIDTVTHIGSISF